MEKLKSLEYIDELLESTLQDELLEILEKIGYIMRDNGVSEGEWIIDDLIEYVMEDKIIMVETTTENEKHELTLYYNVKEDSVEAYVDNVFVNDILEFDMTKEELKILLTDYDDMTEEEQKAYEETWEDWEDLLFNMVDEYIEELEEKERSEAMTINEAITQLEDLFNDRDSLLDKRDLHDNAYLKDMEALGIILDILDQLKDYPILEACYDNYLTRKTHLQNEAIEWQRETADESSYEEFAEAQEHFEEKAKRYGLLEEFVENGIC